jgi:hypothetical protein
MFFDTLAGAVPLYRGGKVKILGIGSAERSPAVREVPTMAEALPRPAVAERLDRLALEPMTGTPADAAKFFAEESRLWGKVIADATIKAD